MQLVATLREVDKEKQSVCVDDKQYFHQIIFTFIGLAYCRCFKGKAFPVSQHSRQDTQGVQSPKRKRHRWAVFILDTSRQFEDCTVKISLIHVFHAFEKENSPCLKSTSPLIVPMITEKSCREKENTRVY